MRKAKMSNRSIFLFVFNAILWVAIIIGYLLLSRINIGRFDIATVVYACSTPPPPVSWWSDAPWIGLDLNGQDTTDEIITPPNNTSYYLGQVVGFSCNRAVDYDTKQGGGEPTAYPVDQMSSSYPQWFCQQIGSFQGGINVGANVTWIAPNSPGSAWISVVEDDLPMPLPPGDGGTRNDEYARLVAQHNVFAVGVTGVQWDDDGTWTTVGPTETLYVLKGTTVEFQAIKGPSAASWPGGKPVWGGSSGASGNGTTKSVTFNAVSPSSTEPKTVTCECGNVVTVNVLVFELTGDLTPEDDCVGRSYDSYGLEEIVYLDYETNPAGIWPPVEWVKTGTGNVYIGDEGPEYDAGPGDYEDSPNFVDLQLQVTDGPSRGQGPTYSISILKPDGGYMIQKPNTGIRHTINTCSCGFLGISYLAPKTVSFTHLEIREGSCTGIGTGFYSGLDGLPHPPSAAWYDVEDLANCGTGCKEGYGQDEIYSGEQGPTYSVGDFVWPIPKEYRASDDEVHTFVSNSNQHWYSDSYGKCTISKFGAGPFYKDAAADSSVW